MKILYIHQYFRTPSEPGGTRSYWLAQELIKNGHTVTMITSKDQLEKDIVRKSVDGIEVIYIKESYNQNMTIWRRLKAFFNFMYKSTKIGFQQKKVDLIFATSTPLTIGIPALLIRWFRKTPYIFEVRDLWPEVPIQMGALNNRVLQWSARTLEKIIYRNADHVIALSPGMQDGIIKYIPKERTSMIPNMAKKDEFWPREKDLSLMASLGLSEFTFKVIHFGALGLANGVDTILNAAELMKEDGSVQFIFLGGGSMEWSLKKECKTKGLDNVFFLPKTPMRETSEIVNFCDISLVSFKDLPILYTNSPNKLFDSLSAGKPIIVNSAGWTKNLVEDYNCGFYVHPNKPEELMNKIKKLQAHSEYVQEMGANARKLAEEKYDKSILSKEFVDVITKWSNS